MQGYAFYFQLLTFPPMYRAKSNKRTVQRPSRAQQQSRAIPIPFSPNSEKKDTRSSERFTLFEYHFHMNGSTLKYMSDRYPESYRFLRDQRKGCQKNPLYPPWRKTKFDRLGVSLPGRRRSTNSCATPWKAWCDSVMNICPNVGSMHK